jgi:hypothetical protein
MKTIKLHTREELITNGIINDPPFQPKKLAELYTEIYQSLIN